MTRFLHIMDFSLLFQICNIVTGFSSKRLCDTDTLSRNRRGILKTKSASTAIARCKQTFFSGSFSHVYFFYPLSSGLYRRFRNFTESCHWACGLSPPVGNYTPPRRFSLLNFYSQTFFTEYSNPFSLICKACII